MCLTGLQTHKVRHTGEVAELTDVFSAILEQRKCNTRCTWEIKLWDAVDMIYLARETGLKEWREKKRET